jgi:hypothetical protein
MSSIGASRTGFCPEFDRPSCLCNRHGHHHRRKWRPSAAAIPAALAPARDVIVTAATAVTIGRIASVARVRISPAGTVNAGVSPVEARRSRRSSRNNKTTPGNDHRRVFSAVPHEFDPCGNRVVRRAQSKTIDRNDERKFAGQHCARHRRAEHIFSRHKTRPTWCRPLHPFKASRLVIFLLTGLQRRAALATLKRRVKFFAGSLRGACSRPE